MKIKSAFLPIAAVMAATAIPATAQGTKVPRYEDYAVRQIYSGPPAPLVLDSEAKRTFRTRLRAAAAGKPNFAGRYSIVTWGCGTQCIAGMIVNHRTGEVLPLPDADDVEAMDMKFKPDSALLVMTNRSYVPQLDDERKPTITFLAFDGKRFKTVHRQVDSKRKWSDYPATD